MFKLTYPDGSSFKKLTTGVLATLDAVPISVTQEGLEIKGLSPDKLTMVILNIPSYSFEEIEVDSETQLTLEKDDFQIAIKRLTRRDKVILSYEDGAREVKLSAFNTKTGVERVFNIRIREEQVESVGELDVELEADIQMSGDTLSTVVKDVATISDELEFRVVKDKIGVYASGEDKEYDSELSFGKGLISMSSSLEVFNSKYHVDLLKPVIKGLSSDAVVNMRFGPGKPMRLQINMEGGVSIIYWLAPRA